MKKRTIIAILALPVFESKNTAMDKPAVLDERHIAAATVHPVIDRGDNPLLYTALIPNVGVISELRPLNKEGTSLTTVQKVQNGAITEAYWSVTFDW